MLTWSWFFAVAVLLLLWLYLYSYGYGSGQRQVPGLPFDVGADGAGAGKSPTTSSTTTTTTTTAATTTTADPMTATQKPGGVTTTRPAVVLRQGTYVGTTLLASHRFPKALEAFRGVPYAQDTSGENRFRPPQPLPKSDEVFDAVRWGKICPTEGVVLRYMGEDCLNANIYRPAGLVDDHGYERTTDGTKKRPRLPVIVYIHGGGFNKGNGTERNMASFAAWAKDPIISVSFNYRVGALGFLPSEVAAREGLLNLGLRDQQMLLDWVQDNIEAFGGDPGNVSIMGLSAGAHSIGHHIMYYSRRSSPAPFVKAILESGATTARAVYYPTHYRHLVQFREFLIAVGAAGVPESELFDYLRKLPLEIIVSASKVVWDKYVGSVTWPFQPVIDSPNQFANSSQAELAVAPVPSLIPNLPIKSWLSGSHVRVPIITGFSTNEGTMFVPPDADTTAEFRSFFQTLIPTLTSADLDKLEALYPDPVTVPSSPYRRDLPPGVGRQYARLDAAYSHYAYICPVLQTAHYMSLSGVGPVYVYRYAATSAGGTANHGDEAPAVAHDVWELRGRPGMRAVARTVHGRWARFVVSEASSPNVQGSGSSTIGDGDDDYDYDNVEWPPFVSPFGPDGDRKGTGKIMVFGEGNDEMGGGWHKGVPAKVVEMTELEKEACRFWWPRVFLSEGMGWKDGEPPATGARL
ncbi:Alpha/Beta hydrolase protein [Corynascus novoguineensis]|uniref:Carboxylic ester hydrolase n=1 Tax=Corynascus novoguineensis TaxID=1126955 RepID=A0AAN7HNS5_9PEZI|nr:Alpha/Beta hydrolase protein [Corynascus novoguineensis]